jgi:hypothetical protein
MVQELIPLHFLVGNIMALSIQLRMGGWRSGKDKEESAHGLTEVLSQHLPGVTSEEHKNPRPGQLASRLRFEPSTSRIWVKSYGNGDGPISFYYTK